MEKTIFYKIYVSMREASFAETDLDLLLLNARKYNALKSITGILFYVDGFFIHYLEGRSEDVATLFGKISKDTRHHDIQVLKTGTRTARRFPEWKMLLKNIAADETEAFFGASRIQESDLFGSKDKAYSIVSNLFATIPV